MSSKLPVGIVQHSFIEDIDFNRARNLTAIENLASRAHALSCFQNCMTLFISARQKNVDNFDLAQTLPGDFTEFYGSAAANNNVVIVTSTFGTQGSGALS